MCRFNMAAPMSCCLHIVSDENGPIIPLSDVSFDKICQCVERWRCLHGPEREIANEIAAAFAEQSQRPGDLGYHRKCYARFTDKTKIERAEKRAAKSLITPIPDETHHQSPKKLRSQVPPVNQPRRSKHVLPEQCIICRKDKYILQKHDRKRLKEKLSTCEYESGGLLVDAARIRHDERLLMEVRGKDMVATEVRYHRTCYKEYINVIMREKLARETNKRLYTDAFERFCSTVIEEKILANGEVYRVSRLRDMFVQTAQDICPDDVNDVRISYLKQKLMARYPQLQFIRPSSRTVCEIVYAIGNETDFADQLESSETTDTDAGPDDEDIHCHQRPWVNEENTRRLYLCTMYLKQVLSEVTGLKNKWPPTAADFQICALEEIIPPQLYNLLAWLTGPSDELCVCDDAFVHTAEDTHLKLLSISQDIIYLSSRGRTPTPKHLALGLTLRHLTGSSNIISLLNRFGHCVSHSIVLEFDTALASLQMKQMDVIPRGFQRKIHTIAVWDNNDFAEDTLSGHGTTHNTNGVLIQRSVDVCTTEEPIRLRKTKERSVSAPLVEIVPFLGKRKQNPSLVDSSLLEPSPEIQQLYLALDVAFCLCKIPEVSRNLFPGWTGFNTLLQEKDVPTVSRIGYLPVIDASPTQMSTVHTILLRSVEIADSLHVNNLVVVFDQAIYCKAQEIRWQSDLFKERLVIRLGDFHTTMTFLACVGKRFQETGLEDILIDAEEVAAGSVKGVLNGHHYNRSMRTHKLMFEALQRLRWAAFMEDLGLDERAVATDVVNDMHEAGLSPALCTLLKEPRVMDILDKYQSFIDRERAARPLFDYWSSYLDMVSILLLYVRATREGNWPLHLSATKTMVCWMFAYDRVNYARYLPAYIAEIENLPTTHPTVHESFMTGDFVVQRQSNYGFSQVACDMAIEQTINRDSKTKGGMTGLTQNKTSVNRWILSHHERADIAKACQTMCGTSDNSRMKRDLDQSSMKREENAVVALTNTIESMTHPFTYRGEHLLNISSGLVVSDDIESDLLQAHRIGKEAFEAFCKERILTGAASSIHQPIRTKKLKTFASSRKKSLVTKLKSETVTLKCNSALFSRLLIVGKTRDINLRQLLAHSLNPIPASLGTNEGLNVKTNKAALMHAMEADVPDSRMENVPASSALVIDGMAMLQALVSIPLTFGALADSILLQVIRLAKKFGCTRVDFVVDRYPLISIKSCEHIRRAASGSQVVNITRADQKTPKQFKKFLSAGKNKESLVEFLFAEWSRSALPELNLKIIEIQRLDSGVRVTVIDELRCDHDEADTRLLLHAKHASTTHNDIMIKSPDTDVFILAVAASHQIDARLLFMTGTGAHSRIVDVNMVSAWYGQHTSRAILGLHVFTGCDSVSAFRGKGKLKAFRLFLQSPTAIQVFKQLGIDWIPSLDILSGLEEFVCALYNQPSFTDVNEARYKLFTLKHRIDETIPPNRDCLRQHSLRAGYQCAVHRRCLDSSINAPSPVDHGWKMENGNLEIQWMCDPPAPPSVLQEVHCKCSNSKCQRGNCSCVKAGLVCTDMCRCNDCFNSQEVGATPDYFADSGDDESEDDL